MRQHGEFYTELTLGDLEQHCILSPQDKIRIKECRFDHAKLGFAVQLCTLKLLHTFPMDFRTTPQPLIDYVAQQLKLEPSNLKHYLGRRPTRFDHQRELREYLGYRVFKGAPVITALRWLYAKVSVASESPTVLFNSLVAELIVLKVQLPGATTLTKLIQSVRERIAKAEYKKIAARLSSRQAQRLNDLLIVKDKTTRLSPLQHLREAPTMQSTKATRGAFTAMLTQILSW
jgi:hypothetical protein